MLVLRTGLGTGILFEALTPSLIHFNQEVFDILDLSLYRFGFVTQLPVSPFQSMKLFLQAVLLRPLPLSIPGVNRFRSGYYYGAIVVCVRKVCTLSLAKQLSIKVLKLNINLLSQ